MFPAHIQTALTVVERHCSDLSAALVSGEPLELASASAALRQGVSDFSDLVGRLTTSEFKNRDLKARLKTLAATMIAQKEGLIRRSVLVDLALNAIVPATRSTTYAQVTGPYGSPGKQSGAFNFLIA